MITLREALTIDRLQKLESITGLVGFDRNVNGVTIMDIPDIVNWLSDGELVITGILFEEYFSFEMVDSMLEKNVAAVVTKKKFIRNLSPELLDYCKKKELPILLAPPDYSWAEIMNPLISYIAQKPYLILKKTQQFHTTMMQAMIDGSPLPEICNRMKDISGYSFAVIDNEFNPVGGSSDFDWSDFTHNISTESLDFTQVNIPSHPSTDICIYTYRTSSLRAMNKKEMLFPVIINHESFGYISWITDQSVDQSNPLDLLRIQQFGLFVALHAKMQKEIRTETRRFNGLLIDRLLDTNITHTQEKCKNLLAPLGKEIYDTYYAIQILYPMAKDKDAFSKRNDAFSSFHETIESRLPTGKQILIYEQEDSQTLFIPCPAQDLDAQLHQIHDLFRAMTNIVHIGIGVSDPTPLIELNIALQQAKRAAQYLMYQKNDTPYLYYHDLGILKFFLDRNGELDDAFLRSQYDKYITPIRAHDAQYHTDLFRTLETYLEQNCSKTETEKILFIHKNTLRSRLQSIGNILHLNIDHMEDLFQIQMAMKLRFYFEHEA